MDEKNEPIKQGLSSYKPVTMHSVRKSDDLDTLKCVSS